MNAASGRRVELVLEVSLPAVGVDKRLNVELCQLLLELAGGGLVVGVADSVVHEFDQQLDDHHVEFAGVEVAHPDERVTDVAVVGTVRTDQSVGKLLVDHRERVRDGEPIEPVVGLDNLPECLDQRLGNEPSERVGVGHDRVCRPAGTVVRPHPEVEVVRVDPLPAGQLHAFF